MTRGDILVAGQRGAYTGKPRPWVVVQNAVFLDEPASVTVCPISAGGRSAVFRVAVLPDPRNMLREASVILIDKVMTLEARGMRDVTGSFDSSVMQRVDEALRYWLAL